MQNEDRIERTLFTSIQDKFRFELCSHIQFRMNSESNAALNEVIPNNCLLLSIAYGI